MNRIAWLFVSGVVWAWMMFLLFEREIRPYFEYRQEPTYQAAYRDLRAPKVERRGVFFGETRIGEAEQLAEPMGEGRGARLRSRLLMDMAPFGGSAMGDDRAYMTTDVKLDGEWQLSQFRLGGSLKGITVTANGDRQGDKLRLSYAVLFLKGDFLVDFPKDATLSDTFLPYQGGARLSVGKKWKIRMFDMGNVLSLGRGQKVELTQLYAEVVERAPRPSLPDEAPLWRVEVRREPTEEVGAYQVWVDDEGTVREQHMRINNLLCRIVLEEQAELPPGQAGDHAWRVLPPGR